MDTTDSRNTQDTTPPVERPVYSRCSLMVSEFSAEGPWTKCGGVRYWEGEAEHTCGEPCRFVMGKDGTAPSEHEIENNKLRAEIKSLEAALRLNALTASHYVANVALKQLWDMLNAAHQTEAVLALRHLLARK